MELGRLENAGVSKGYVEAFQAPRSANQPFQAMGLSPGTDPNERP
jgi:hypothetical protein